MKVRRLFKNEKEEIVEKIEEQYGIPKEVFKDFDFYMAGKHKVWIMHKVCSIKLENKLGFDLLKKCFRVGLLLGEIDKRGFRFTIEGTMLFGKYAKKNIIEISKEEVKLWLRGLDLDKKVDENLIGKFVIIKCGNDYLGCGLVTKRGIKNLIPTIRRIKSYEEI